MSPEELKQHVRKASVFGKPDFDPDEKPYTLEEYAADFFRCGCFFKFANVDVYFAER